jgi:hypothetical protein
MPETVKGDTNAADEAEVKRRLEQLSSASEDMAEAEAKIKAAMTADEDPHPPDDDEGVNDDEVGVVDGDIIEEEEDPPEIEVHQFTFACPHCRNKITVESKTWVGSTKCYRCGHIIDQATLSRLIEESGLGG